MKRAAIIKDGVVVNATNTETLIHPDGWTMVYSDTATIGDLWNGTVFSKPPLTLEEIEYAKTDYQRKRAVEYPDFKDYLDGIVKGDEAQIQAYITKCLAVKTKYPAWEIL